MNLIQRWIQNLLIKPLQGSVKRFPFTIIYSFLLGLIMVLNEELELNWLTDVAQSLFIFLPVMLSATLARETFPFWRWSKVLETGILLSLTGFYFLYLQLESNLAIGFFRFSNLGFGFYFLPLFIRYYHQEDIEKPIIEGINGILTALVYAIILFLGLAVILLSTNILFNLSIALSVYSNVLILSLTYVFVPTWLHGFQNEQVLSNSKEISIIWQRIFLFVLMPVISIFIFFILIYLLTGLFQSQEYNAGIYTLSTLLIAFVGISTHVSTRRLTSHYPFVKVYQTFFPWALLLVIVGYYIELVRLGLAFGFSLSIVLQLCMGLWPIYYVWLTKKSHPQATQRGLLSLVIIYVFVATMPFINGVGLTRLILQQQYDTTLDRLALRDDQGTIIPNNNLEQQEVALLSGILDNMKMLGFETFRGVPESYDHPADFVSTFGTYDNQVEPTVEDYTFSLQNQIIDFTAFDYDRFIYVPSLPDLEDNPYSSETLSMSFLHDDTNEQLLWTLTLANSTETINIVDDILVLLVDRLLEEDSTVGDYMATNWEDLRIQFSFEAFTVDVWVQSLIFFRGFNYSNFTMSAYVGFHYVVI
jgi:hypothetical protein